VLHNTAKNSSDNFPSYPRDNHHSSDVVYWKRRGDQGLETLSVMQVSLNVLVIHLITSDKFSVAHRILSQAREFAVLPRK